MAVPETRQRSVYLFVAVVLAHVIVISAQVTTRSGAPMLEAVAFGLFSEVQRAGAAVVSVVTGAWSGYIDLRGLRADNERLSAELARSRIELQQERSLAQRTRALGALLELRERAAIETTAAHVIAAAATPDFRTVTIGKGAADGLRSDMAVIAPAGVVGRIIVPSARAAKVQLLIDRNAAAGALVERSRVQGVVVGSGGGRLALEFVSGAADVVEGDTVLTSGIDGIYPKGFVIGTVEQIDRSGGAVRSITIEPAVDFSRLEEVLVVLAPPTPEDPASEVAR
jgi:rod shape-determining protein MreC